MFFHNPCSHKSHKHKLTGLLCAPTLKLPTAVAAFNAFFRTIQFKFLPDSFFCHYRLGQFDPLNFLFSGRVSFPQMGSRRMPWGRKFWQGTLYPSNNLEQAKLWFPLIKQKSVKMIGSPFIEIKFVMLKLTTCIIRNCLLLQKFKLFFRPKNSLTVLH